MATDALLQSLAAPSAVFRQTVGTADWLTASMMRHELARTFHSLHDGPTTLRLANAWDAGSARAIETTGAVAIATTSAGVAWSLGAADGDRLDRREAIDAIARICRAVSLPVTADVESGFGADPDGVAHTIGLVIEAGAVGVNIEDGVDGALRDDTEQATRIAAARCAARDRGFDLFINARTDVYLRGIGEPSRRFNLAVDRADRYLAAGASGVFIPGIDEIGEVKRLVEAVNGPLNIMVGPGSPSVDELQSVGVRRVSMGPAVAQAAYAVATEAATVLRQRGEYSPVAGGIDFGWFNGLWADR